MLLKKQLEIFNEEKETGETGEKKLGNPMMLDIKLVWLIVLVWQIHLVFAWPNNRGKKPRSSKSIIFMSKNGKSVQFFYVPQTQERRWNMTCHPRLHEETQRSYQVGNFSPNQLNRYLHMPVVHAIMHYLNHYYQSEEESWSKVREIQKSYRTKDLWLQMDGITMKCGLCELSYCRMTLAFQK